MTYPDKLLAPGETVAFELKPHWRALIAPAIVLVIEVFVASWLFFSISVSWLRWVIVIAVIVITIWRVLVPFRLLLLTSWTCFVSGAALVFDGRSLSALLGISMRMVAKALVDSMCVGLWVMLVSVVMVHSSLIRFII